MNFTPVKFTATRPAKNTPTSENTPQRDTGSP